MDTDLTPRQRLRLALDMYEFGEQMQRQRLVRERPEATAEQLELALTAWRRHRPGAEYGDAPGPVRLPTE